MDLNLLHNEATRQRTLDLLVYAKAWNVSNCKDEINNNLMIHGQYTEGFYEEQLDKLFNDVKNNAIRKKNRN